MNDNHYQLQGGNFYRHDGAYSVNDTVNKANGNQQNPYTTGLNQDNMAVLRNSARYIPQQNVDVFAQFLNIQAQQGNTNPTSMLRSAVQMQQQQQTQNQLSLVQNANMVEQAIMKRMDFSKSNHPTACFFHLIFKVLGLCTHLLLGLFMDALKVHYLVILFCAIDFWVVKNITGRLLVGLRWWSECQDDNSTKWVFECKINKGEVNDFNFNVFWSLQILASLLWATLVVINLIGFDFGDTAECAFALFCSFWNTYYFYKCNTSTFMLSFIKKITHFTTKIGQKEGLKKLAAEMQSDIPLNFMHGSVRFPL